MWGSRRLSSWFGWLLPPQTHPAGQQSDKRGRDDSRPTRPDRESGCFLYGGKNVRFMLLLFIHCSDFCVRGFSHLNWSVTSILSLGEGVAVAESCTGVWNLPEGCLCAALHHRSHWEVRQCPDFHEVLGFEAYRKESSHFFRQLHFRLNQCILFLVAKSAVG